MFNYYTYQKKRNEKLKEKNRKKNEIKMIEINKIKRDELTHNYEKRVKKFIYNLRDDPNYLSNSNISFLPLNSLNITKQEEKSSFINPKRFCFSHFETDRMRAEKYDKQQKQLKNLLDKNFPIKKNIKDNRFFKSLNPKIKNFELVIDDSNQLNNDTKSNNNKMIQPRLRFKPRNDMERLLDQIKDLRIHGNINYLNALKKLIIKMQKLEFNNELKKKNSLGKKIISYKNKIIENYNKEYSINNLDFNKIKKYINIDKENIIFRNFFNKTENKIKKDKHFLENIIKDKSDYENTLHSNGDNIENLSQDELIKIKKIGGKMMFPIKSEDIFKAFLIYIKKLRKGYDIKTYFNCMKNYSLWKNTCFINNKLTKRRNKNNSIKNYKNKNAFSHMSKFDKGESINEKDNLKNASKTFYKKIDNFKKKSNKKKDINPLKLIPLLNDYKNNILKIDKFEDNKSEENKINNKNKENIFNDNKLDIIKKIAFDKDFKENKYLSNKFTENYKNYKKRILNLKNYNAEENEENKNNSRDLGEISNKILKKFGFIKNIYRKSDASYSKEGNGKLMFTNGLTINEFLNLHNLSA